jgi:thiazole synthase
VQIVVNGTPRAAAPGSTVASLLAELSIRAERVAVERNLDIVAKERFADTALAEGDRIEIIQFVGGGAPQRVTA